ncbi:MAG TPA: NAD(P)H-dependent oxidoreductase [Tepidisphaeraceae bacterium]|nr:NAD(P)H-dependent oxidoreductase [Tepidisphaeraceae bacterium]
MADRPILIVSGTNRPSSNTLRIARVIQQHYQDHNLSADFFDVTDLPREVFEPTVYASKPAPFVEIQNRVYHAAGLHLVLPEYNGSFPGILKYFIDLLKFPESFDRKPVAFVGLANGMFGALRAVEQLQMVFSYRNAHVYPDRVFIPAVRDKLDATGKVSDPAIVERLAKQAKGFAQFAGAVAAH